MRCMTIGLITRPATTTDAPAVAALVESAYRGDSSRAGWTTEADLLGGQRTDVQEGTGLLSALIVAEDGGVIVGCCAMERHGDDGHFGMFAVTPVLQGAGIGSWLL